MRKLTEQEIALQNKIKDIYKELNKLFPKVDKTAAELEKYCKSKKRCSECAFQLDDCGTIDVIRDQMDNALRSHKEETK